MGGTTSGYSATFFYLVILLLHDCHTSDVNQMSLVAEEMASFVRDNTGKCVSIACQERAFCPVLHRAFMKDALVMSRQMTMERRAEMSDTKRDFNVFVVQRPDSVIFEQTLQLVADAKRRSSLIYFSDNLTMEDLSQLRTTLSNLGRNSFFYFASGSTVPLRWHQVITLNHQEEVAISPVQFVEGTHTVREKYNLQGMRVTSISDTWAPHLVFEDCNEEMMQCKTSYGALYDQSQLIAQLFNFTMISIQGQKGWGVAPVEGPYNCSGTWAGIMGDVINGVYPVSLSEWNYRIERNELLDFVSLTHSDNMQLVLTPQPAEVDTGLFIRPFTDEAWKAILGMTVIIITVLLIPYFIFSFFELTTGYKIASTSGWYFFVLLNAFYGGALTMFFTSEVSIPFEGVRDVIRAYDDWKLIMMAGELQVICLKGDRANFWMR